jgi:hypothetical protein
MFGILGMDVFGVRWIKSMGWGEMGWVGHTRPEEAPVATMVLVRGAVILVVGMYLSLCK